MVHETFLRDVDPGVRKCLYHDENGLFENHYISNEKCGRDVTCAQRVRNRDPVRVLANYSQTGCTFECMLRATHHVDVFSSFDFGGSNHPRCLPWDLPQVSPNCEAKKQVSFHCNSLTSFAPVFTCRNQFHTNFLRAYYDTQNRTYCTTCEDFPDCDKIVYNYSVTKSRLDDRASWCGEML